jgi:hypothetical protein
MLVARDKTSSHIITLPLVDSTADVSVLFSLLEVACLIIS